MQQVKRNYEFQSDPERDLQGHLQSDDEWIAGQISIDANGNPIPYKKF